MNSARALRQQVTMSGPGREKYRFLRKGGEGMDLDYRLKWQRRYNPVQSSWCELTLTCLNRDVCPKGEHTSAGQRGAFGEQSRGRYSMQNTFADGRTQRHSRWTHWTGETSHVGTVIICIHLDRKRHGDGVRDFHRRRRPSPLSPRICGVDGRNVEGPGMSSSVVVSNRVCLA